MRKYLITIGQNIILWTVQHFFRLIIIKFQIRNVSLIRVVSSFNSLIFRTNKSRALAQFCIRITNFGENTIIYHYLYWALAIFDTFFDRKTIHSCERLISFYSRDDLYFFMAPLSLYKQCLNHIKHYFFHSWTHFWMKRNMYSNQSNSTMQKG